MKVLFYIIVAFLIPWIIGFIVIFIREGYKIAKGEISRDELEHNVNIYKRYKRIKNSKKKSKNCGLSSGSYPPPLNRWYGF